MRYSSLLLPGLLCLLTSLSLQAAVYTYVDKDGNRVFTDQSNVEGSTRVQVRETNYISMPLPVKKLSPPPSPQDPVMVERKDEARVLPYTLLRIVLPEPDAAIRSGDGGLVVAMESEPELQEGHQYRLEVDGKPRNDQHSPVFTLENLDRGTHQLVAEIVDDQGKVLERTPAQPVHILRTSLNDIDRRIKEADCKDDDFGSRPECPVWYKTRLPTPPKRTTAEP